MNIKQILRSLIEQPSVLFSSLGTQHHNQAELTLPREMERTKKLNPAIKLTFYPEKKGSNFKTHDNYETKFTLQLNVSNRK